MCISEDPKDLVLWWGYGTEESIELIILESRLARVITTKSGKCVKLSWRWGDTREERSGSDPNSSGYCNYSIITFKVGQTGGKNVVFVFLALW